VPHVLIITLAPNQTIVSMIETPLAPAPHKCGVAWGSVQLASERCTGLVHGVWQCYCADIYVMLVVLAMHVVLHLQHQE
jgi:hypothetical protein